MQTKRRLIVDDCSLRFGVEAPKIVVYAIDIDLSNPARRFRWCAGDALKPGVLFAAPEPLVLNVLGVAADPQVAAPVV